MLPINIATSAGFDSRDGHGYQRAVRPRRLPRDFLKGRTKAYLQQWRKVKNDKSLKSVPSYFELARMRRLDTAWITSPMNRCCLLHLSQTCNFTSSIAIVRLNKTLGRNSVRLDGRCPTLTDGCTNMFVPAAATMLSVEQLVCVTGVHPEQHSEVFECISRIGWVGGQSQTLT